MKHPLHPSLYQVNARLWLGDVARGLGRPATLDDVPDADLDRLAALGFDWVYLLGAWRTGPAGRAVSRSREDWRRGFAEDLPDLADADIVGSPFAVQSYDVHEDFGGDAALARLRTRLRSRGLRLMLDFVPNHTAIDHPWVTGHPDYYVAGTEDDLAREPDNYLRVRAGGRSVVLAYGRDPYFPGWPDTLQLNYRHPALRAAMAGELARVAARCDGVRCDMAMLVLPDVFARTWGDRSAPRDGPAPVDEPFWPGAIAEARATNPGFRLMAEAYWDLEWALQQQGFDWTYDKRLYDRLRGLDAGAVRGHLTADAEYQRKSARFLENHDEPRAAATFAPEVHPAAATLTYLVPGLRFVHDGQLEGRRSRTSIHIGRRRDESVDPMIQCVYEKLLKCLARPEVRDGRWRLLECRPAWDGNPSWDRFLAFLWDAEGSRLLVAVNYGPTRGQCYVALPPEGLRGGAFRLEDLLGDEAHDREGDDLAARGLYLDVPAWGHHAFAVARLGGGAS
ncbi:MAG TPA: alpha-amylase family glycosyl hydrolase [Isosphaeraceae bacterium]|jgi:hypothetical protein|nr:alpha-amylase family glycosyl hydrolase [Isosphaeraceae bacterium]